MRTKLSIIVPIHNKEKYLIQTLTSILVSVFNHDASVILIDDESTDKSSEIALEYAMRYPNIFSYYRIKHEGKHNPCHARNVGTELADSDYVLYFDADDLLLSGYLDRAVSYLDSHQECNFYIESEYQYNLKYPNKSEFNNCNTNETKENWIHSILFGFSMMLYGVMRLDLVKKMGSRYGLFDSDLYEDLKFTGKYILIFGGLHVETKPVARLYFVHTENSVADTQTNTSDDWQDDYIEYLNKTLKSAGFYCVFNQESQQYEYALPATQEYFR